MTLLLVVRDVLPSPLLYLSAWFEATREEYYAHLLAVTRDGAWERWLVYFLTGVCTQAEDALARIQDIDDLHERWREELAGVQSGRPEQVLRLFVGNPFRTVRGVAQELDVAYTTARRAIDRLEDAGIVSLVGPRQAQSGVLRAGHARYPGSTPRGGKVRLHPGPGSRRCRMTVRVSERAFEDAIEAALLEHGPDALPDATGKVGEEPPPYHDPAMRPGGYHKRRPEDYDRTLCLLPADVLDFILATQPKQWQRLSQHHGAEVKARFLKRLSSEIERRGVLDVLRRGVKDMGCAFRLAYFRPASGLNEETRRLHAANFFSVARQVRYSTRNEKSLDMVLFLNGLPVFTAELKNPLTGQTVEDAIRQYKTDRDPREPLLAYGRCLAHFAVDTELVYVTTHLAGPKTRFLPFNRGRFGGAGNPPVPPTQDGYATAYLWEETWARDSVLDLVRQFIHEVEEEDETGRKTGRRFLIFPRHQQLDCVRRLVSDARATGAGQRYLVQHSAGSGKSFTIAWVAHQLSTLHGADDRRVFDSIVVVTDRRVLDRQLQSTIRQFEQTLGVVENIDTTSRQLKDALEAGKTIIVTTLQKFPVIAAEIGQLPGKRFALIVDEAHSSQSGESTKSLKAVLSPASLEDAEREESGAETPEEALENAILAEMEKRGPLPNLSTFAFTATPKSKTLELFGTGRPDGSFAPFHLYSMRQAIEEGFILDVLASYTTYQGLLAAVEDGRGRSALREEEGGVAAAILRRPASARDRRQGPDHGRALRRARAGPDRRSGEGDDRYPLAPARGALQAGRGRLSRRAGPSVHGAGGVLRHRERRGPAVHRDRHERVPRDADGQDVRGAGLPVPRLSRTSSRRGSTSRCSTRCTWTRSSAGSTRCRRCRG